MDYKIDPKTMLFEELTEEQAYQLHLLGQRIVLDGYVDMQHPAFLAWTEAAQYDEDQKLLVYATAFPQRVLLSVCRFHALRFSYHPA